MNVQQQGYVGQYEFFIFHGIESWMEFFLHFFLKYLITSNTDSFAKNLHILWTSVLILIKDPAPKAMNVNTNEDKP